MPETPIHAPRPVQTLDPRVDVAERPGLHVLHDFCLMPYEVRRSTAGQLASESLLRRTWQLAGVTDEATAIAERLRARLGPGCTVWGAKLDSRTGQWSWELYFYRREHTPAELSPALVAACIAPVRIENLPPADMAWTFFSVGLNVAALREGGSVRMRLYIECRNLSWVVGPDGLELENHYTVYDVRTRLPAFARALRSSPHVPHHPLALARVMPPPLHRCWRIWLASKRTCETVYAQRMETGDLLVFLRHLGWPETVTGWLHERLDLFSHVLWDASHDFQRQAVADTPGEPPVRILKGACYASL